MQDTIESGFATGNNIGNGSGFGVEVAAAYNMDNGFSFFLGGAMDDDNTGDYYVINAYVTFETGAWIFAAELNYGDADPAAAGAFASDGYSGLLMANFAYSESASVTARFSYFDNNSDAPGSLDADGEQYTLAHGYAFTDNLFLVNEISYIDVEQTQGVMGAAELIFSF